VVSYFLEKLIRVRVDGPTGSVGGFTVVGEILRQLFRVPRKSAGGPGYVMGRKCGNADAGWLMRDTKLSEIGSYGASKFGPPRVRTTSFGLLQRRDVVVRRRPVEYCITMRETGRIER
jgi:hypothetical protein